MRTSLFNRVQKFPLNNLSFIWPIKTQLSVLVVVIKTQLGVDTQKSVNKVKVTVV